MNIRFATVTLLVGAVALAGCKTQAPDVLPPSSTETVQPDPVQTMQPTGPTLGSQAHFEDAVSGQNVIYFDTDRYNIDTADATALQTQAQYLARYPSINITIEGHCDERGTRDYNLALGERRANAAKNYLVSLGVDSGRIRTVSFGKERPIALGSNQSAWAENRRAVSVVIS